MSRPAVLCLLAAVVVALWATPAAADGARPGNFESVLDEVAAEDPEVLDRVEVDVVGNDAFLRLRADPGTRVDVPGYDGEPYLRIDADGTVSRNRLSPATYLNEERDGEVSSLPEGVAADAEPEWEVIGDDGSVAWHDHRIHWMGSAAPPRPPDGVVSEWAVPFEVDGVTAGAAGRLVLRPDLFPWPAAVTVVVAVVVAWAGDRMRWRAPLLVGAGAAATASSAAWYAQNPPGAAPSVVALAMAGAALTAAAGAWAARGRAATMVLPLASAAALVGWFLTRVGVWWMPMLPTPLVPWVERVLSSTVLGVAVGVVAAVLIRPVPGPAADQDSISSTPSSQSSTPPMS